MSYYIVYDDRTGRLLHVCDVEPLSLTGSSFVSIDAEKYVMFMQDPAYLSTYRVRPSTQELVKPVRWPKLRTPTQLLTQGDPKADFVFSLGEGYLTLLDNVLEDEDEIQLLWMETGNPYATVRKFRFTAKTGSLRVDFPIETGCLYVAHPAIGKTYSILCSY